MGVFGVHTARRTANGRQLERKKMPDLTTRKDLLKSVRLVLLYTDQRSGSL